MVVEGDRSLGEPVEVRRPDARAAIAAQRKAVQRVEQNEDGLHWALPRSARRVPPGGRVAIGRRPGGRQCARPPIVTFAEHDGTPQSPQISNNSESLTFGYDMEPRHIHRHPAVEMPDRAGAAGAPGTLTAALAPPVTATRRPVRPTPTPEDAARDVPPTVTGVRRTGRGSVIVTRTRVGHIGRLPSARRIYAL